MGSPLSEKGRNQDEMEPRKVQIEDDFAIGVHEVTFAQWDACHASGGCGHVPGADGSGRGQQPVRNVSWHDAQQFVAWLTKETGETYRLPTEAEWEFAARAGTATPFWTGRCINLDQSAFNYNEGYFGCPRPKKWRSGTVEVGTLPANPFGLHEVLGNVWEWVRDCWRDNGYQAAVESDSDLSACQFRVIRGGSENTPPAGVRSANRGKLSADTRKNDVGFRVATSTSRKP
jgi:formylglycine-generating enzyme required for sulfatase activity